MMTKESLCCLSPHDSHTRPSVALRAICGRFPTVVYSSDLLTSHNTDAVMVVIKSLLRCLIRLWATRPEMSDMVDADSAPPGGGSTAQCLRLAPCGRVAVACCYTRDLLKISRPAATTSSWDRLDFICSRSLKATFTVAFKNLWKKESSCSI